MTVALFFLIALFLILTTFNKWVKKVIFDGFFYVIAPYVAIICLNNLYWVKQGFYQIKDYVIYVHLWAMLLFFAGTALSYYITKRMCFIVGPVKSVQMDVDIKKVKYLSIICHAIVVIDVLYRYSRYGVTALVSDEEEFNAGFLSGHAQNLLVPLTVILVDYIINLKKKDRMSWIMAAVSMLCIASAFVKYHIMSTVIAVFIYCAIKNPRKARRLGIIVGILIIAFFVSNYALGFVARGESVSSVFYFNHFWQYTAGGTINLDLLNKQYVNCDDLSIGCWLLVNIMAFPNMFILKLFGTKIPHYTVFGVPFFPVGDMGELSNVASIITAIFVQSNAIEFTMIVFLWGFIVEWARSRSYVTRNECSKTILSIFLAFNVLSFFSSMFVLSSPWEMMLMTYVVFAFAGDRKKRHEEITIQYLSARNR